MKTQSKYLIVFIPLYLILFLSCSVQNASIVGKWDWKESDLSHGGCCSFVDTTTMNIMLHKAYMEFTEDGKYRLIDSLGMPVNDALYAKD
jgi:hypothetical protein